MVQVDIYDKPQVVMGHVHTALKLAYDNILKLLDDPPMNDLYNFLGYCTAFTSTLHEHHTGEEANMFPVFVKKIDMTRELEAHKVVHAHLDEIIEYVSVCSKDHSKFNAVELKGKMAPLRAPLFKHLDEEVEDLRRENMELFTREEIKGIFDAIDAHAKAVGDPTVVLPFIFTHMTPEGREVLFDLPWFFTKIMIPWVFGLRHRGYWKYSPYTM